MLETLLESKSKASRSTGGAIASVVAHTALVVAALYATAQARPEPARTRETIIRPMYIPGPKPPSQLASRVATSERQPVGRRLIFVEPKLSIDVPPIDITGSVSTPDDFGATPFGTASPIDGDGGGTGADAAPFSADQVEKQVTVVPGAPTPRYPEVLRSSGVEGQVTALFVVDEHGRAEEESIRFIRSDNRLFEEAVRVALHRMRFIPAEVGGSKVRQLVQMPFVFALAR
jgi:periplasmic protein TonB